MGFGLGIRVRLIRAWHSMRRRRRQRARRPSRRIPVSKLHIGSGPLVLSGWTNVDLVYHPGVDHVLDVRDGLAFEGVKLIYAEHFLEHLTQDEGIRFLAECRAALRPDGVLRLSTPNLDWVWATQYSRSSDDPVRDCFALNKAFRGWGHQFLYNAETLAAALRAAGFETVTFCNWGESATPELTGLERHERYEDTADLPHVIIAEASGVRPLSPELDAVSEEYDQAIRS